MEYTIQMIKLLFILGLFAFGTYVMMKQMKKRQYKKISENRFIQVVDGVNVGMGQGVYLMKVGEEYIMMSSGNNGVAMMKLEQKELSDPKEKWDEVFAQENPNVALQNILKATKERFIKK